MHYTIQLHLHDHSLVHCIIENIATSALSVCHSASCSTKSHQHCHSVAHCIIQPQLHQLLSDSRKLQYWFMVNRSLTAIVMNRCMITDHLPVCNAVASPFLIECCILLVCPTATVQGNQERNHSVGIVDSLTVQCGLFTVHQLHPLLCKIRTSRFLYKPH